MLKYTLTAGSVLFSVFLNAQCLTISCNANDTLNNDAGQCGANVTYTTPVVVTNTCAGAVSDTFSYTGAMQTYVVPAGVTSVNIQTWGAQGGANWVNNNNFGGYVAADVAVTPGSTLYVFVGGQATTTAGGFNGGGSGEGAGKGGGGGTDVRIGGTTYNDRVVVAGGGGGAGYWSSLHVVGGQGGGLTGGNGYRDPDFATNPGGEGATQTAGGADGTCVSFNVTACAGGFGYGGSITGCGCEVYGGGGGWYGGAASGNCRGGGGGSGYAIPTATNVVMNTGVRAGNGMVIISYSGASNSTVSQVAGLPSGSFFPAGATVNTFVASDQFGNADTCTFTVYVTDTEVPVLSNIPSNVTVNADSGMCSAVVSWTPPSTTDNCTVVLNSNYGSGSSFPVGTTSVVYTATDPQGNADTASFTITVNDTQLPWWTSMPTDTTVTTDSAQCSAVVNWVPASASDNCGIASVTSSANSGDNFPVGTTTVTYVAIDQSGNADTASFNVTVIDSEFPVIVCAADVTVNADSGMCSASGVNLGTTSAADNCVASLTNDAPAIFPVGTTVVTYTATDSSGNTSTCQQNVTVLDTEAPVISNCPGAILACEGIVTFNAPMATDNCSASLTQIAGPNSGDSLSVGTYTIIFVAQDSSGNTDSCMFTITVNANPVVTLSLSFTTVCVTDGQYLLQGGSPAGGVWSGTGVSGNMFDPAAAGTGTFGITYMYTDSNGCIGSATNIVDVAACTGIAENGALSFTMYPNPANEMFIFTSEKHGTLQLFDAQGKLVLTQAINATRSEINVGGVESGTYLARFTTESGTVSTGKLIIQK